VRPATLTPGEKDASFFEAFDRQARAVVEAAELLSGLFEQADGAAELARRIADVEHRGDRIAHETITRLHKTWITPLDRSDIHDLTTALGDVLDLIEAVSERVVLFDIDRVTADARVLAQVLVRTCESVHRALSLLPIKGRRAEILELCVEINRLQDEADSIYRKALASLYRPDVAGPAGEGGVAAAALMASILSLLKWRDIYDNLEAAANRCEDVANIIEGIVLEYA